MDVMNACIIVIIIHYTIIDVIHNAWYYCYIRTHVIHVRVSIVIEKHSTWKTYSLWHLLWPMTREVKWYTEDSPDKWKGQKTIEIPGRPHSLVLWSCPRGRPWMLRLYFWSCHPLGNNNAWEGRWRKLGTCRGRYASGWAELQTKNPLPSIAPAIKIISVEEHLHNKKATPTCMILTVASRSIPTRKPLYWKWTSSRQMCTADN